MYTHVEFIDNQPVLDLIEKKPQGILVMLDEEIIMPKGTDMTFLSKVKTRQSRHPAFHIEQKKRFQSESAFTIVHYAGAVQYDSDGFLMKNRDKVHQGTLRQSRREGPDREIDKSVATKLSNFARLHTDAYDLMSTSRQPNTASLFPAMSTRMKGRKGYSMGGQFRKQLNALMTLLYETEPSYIRCVKPNHDKCPNKFIARMCIEQLRYSGVFEAVEIRKTGFPFRLTHKQFVARFRCLIQTRPDAEGAFLKTPDSEPRKQCEEILRRSRQDFSKKGLQIGSSMVLYRAEQHHVLELLRNLALEKIVPFAQVCIMWLSILLHILFLALASLGRPHGSPLTPVITEGCTRSPRPPLCAQG